MRTQNQPRNTYLLPNRLPPCYIQMDSNIQIRKLVEEEITKQEKKLIKKRIHEFINKGVVYYDKKNFFKYVPKERKVSQRIITTFYNEWIESGKQDFVFNFPDLIEKSQTDNKILKGHIGILFPIFVSIRTLKKQGEQRYMRYYKLTETGIALMEKIDEIKNEEETESA